MSSRAYFIQLYNSDDNTLINKFKFILQGSTVKQIKDLIIEKLIHKNQIQKDDQISIKDNDDYQLGSDDQINDVVIDGKVKMYVVKKNNGGQNGNANGNANSNANGNGNNQVQLPSVVVNNLQNNAQNISSIQQSSSSSSSSNIQISSTTSILNLSNFKLPQISQSDKFILKAIIPQIRKSLIQIPILRQFANFLQFSEYITQTLQLPKQYIGILYNSQGCPLIYNLDMILSEFPKLDYSQQYTIILTLSKVSFPHLAIAPMQTKSNLSSIKITKSSQLFPMDIKFQIDLSNTISVLKHRIYQLTHIHPSNQILKFSNTILSNQLQTLSLYNIKSDSIIQLSFKLQSNLIPSTSCDRFYYKDIILCNQQTELAIENFRSHMIVLSNHIKQEDKNKILAVIEKYSQNKALVYALMLMMNDGFVSQASRIALEEGIFTCIMNYIQGLNVIPQVKVNQVFLYIRNFFGFVLDSINKITSTQKINKHFSFVKLQDTCAFTLKTIKNPSIIKTDDGQILLVDKLFMQQQIDKGFTFDQYKKPNKSDLKVNQQLLQAWRNFTYNHIDNDKFTSIYWLGLKYHQTQSFNLSQSHKNIGINTYLPKIQAYPNLQINNPLQLKSKVHRLLLIKTKQNNLHIFVRTNKDIQKPYILFNPITGQQQAVNLDLMSGATSTENTQVKIDITTLKPVITRQPKQAIVVLFDISGSMGCKFFNQPDLLRIGAVKSFFQAFTYRTIAYNLQHVVSLVFFDNAIQVQCDFTQALFDFNTLISNAKPRGSTRLFDSIVHATTQLVQFSKKYPSCKLRILALTDGQDNGSSNSYIDAAKGLVQNNIVIDSFAVGTGCDGLKNVTLATGGKCYLTRNLEESLKLFEQQTVLSVRVRTQEEIKTNLTIEELIQKAKLKPFDQVNSVHKFNVPQIQAINVNSKDIVKQLNNNKQIQHKASSNNSLKRILKQIQKYTSDPHPFVSIYPSADLNTWKILLLGPKQTPYQNGLFILYVRFPGDYPFRAPQIRFITPIYHCNMNSQGRICHSILDCNYSPALSFKQIIDCIYGLILTPQPEDPLDNVVASFYLSDYQVYLKNAKQATMKNANKTAEKLVEELFGEIKDDIKRQMKIQEIEEWVKQAKTHN